MHRAALSLVPHAPVRTDAASPAGNEPLGLIERELRVELDAAAVFAVERCLTAQAGLACPEVIVTTAYFDTASGAGPLSPLEFVVQWAAGHARLASAPAVVERRAREGEWLCLQRLQLPRRDLRLALRPHTRGELIPFFPPELEVLGGIRGRRLMFLDPANGYHATLDRDVELIALSDSLQPESVLRRLPTALLTVRPLTHALPGWLEGLLQVGRAHAPVQQLRAELPAESEPFDESLPMAEVMWLPDESEFDRWLAPLQAS